MKFVLNMNRIYTGFFAALMKDNLLYFLTDFKKRHKNNWQISLVPKKVTNRNLKMQKEIFSSQL
jgi:hypothetical protein